MRSSPEQIATTAPSTGDVLAFLLPGKVNTEAFADCDADVPVRKLQQSLGGRSEEGCPSAQRVSINDNKANNKKNRHKLWEEDMNLL